MTLERGMPDKMLWTTCDGTINDSRSLCNFSEQMWTKQSKEMFFSSEDNGSRIDFIAQQTIISWLV